MAEKKLMKGNEAFAEAAIRGGARYYFGYPITPQNEITEYMSHEMEKNGGSFIQAESELAAVNMAYGAGASGGRVFISSSSIGIALMQEAFSLLTSVEIPVVVMNVSRGGPGIGSIQPAQADYFQATRGGGNGDYHLPVYAPASIQEAVEMIYNAFEVADKMRNPVMILADGMLGQMMEPVSMPEMKEPLKEEDIPRVKPWALTGHGDKRERHGMNSVWLKQDLLEDNVNRYWHKYEEAEKELVDYETYNLEDADVVFVSYGSTSRIAKEAMGLLEKNDGVKVGLIRPRTVWPYPYEAFDKISPKTKHVISVELSKGQMMQDVLIGVKGRWPVSLIERVGGMLLTPPEIEEKTLKILGVK